MLRITHGEESKLTSWYFEIDRGLLGCVILLIFIFSHEETEFKLHSW